MAKDTKKIKIIIVGAGKAGELVSGDIARSTETPFEVVGFVDDNKKKHGTSINHIKVLGSISDLSRLVGETGAEEILIALPSERGEVVRRVIQSSEGKRLVFKIIPRLAEVLAQKFTEDYLKYIRKVDAMDLVGGEISKSDQLDIKRHVSPQTILVTGAAGSIGSELSRQLALYGAKKVIFYDMWEHGMFELHLQLTEQYPQGDFEFIIGDIKNKKKVNNVIKTFKPTTIFHASAYKHVPLMEFNPDEAVMNNIIGTKTVAEAAIKYGVKKFILISTDKAVNPTSVMGATKRAAEKILHILSESQKGTIFSAVRFGNVVNSSGSAIPLFQKQIEKGGPVGVTHKDVTRYFMTIPEATHLILKAWIMSENNNLFVLDMGEPVTIYDLARWLIILNGYIPDQDIHIKIIGLRPGEKLFEEILVKEEETARTSVSNIFKTKNYMNFDRLKFLNNLTLLIESIEADDFTPEEITMRLKLMVTTYNPSKKNRLAK